MCGSVLLVSNIIEKILFILSVAVFLNAVLPSKLGFAVIADYPVPVQWRENWGEHNQVLTRIHWNQLANVAIYADVYSPYNYKLDAQIPHFIAQVWPYMTKTYGNFGPDPYLILVIHLFAGYKFPYQTYHSLSLETPETKINRNLLDIGKVRFQWFSSSTKDTDRDNLVQLLAYFVEYSAKGRLLTPSYAIWQYSGPIGTAIPAWNYIFTYDVYMGLNRTSDALRFKKAQRKKSEDNPRPNTYWFRDWFLPIYTKHGGSKVLNGYFQLLHDHLPYEGNRYDYTLDMGDFVHFWSGAAGADLTEFANKTFGWSEAYQEMLIDAQINFPDVTSLYKKVLPTNETQSEGPQEPTLGDGNLVAIGAGLGGIIALLSFLGLVACVVYQTRKIRKLSVPVRLTLAEQVRSLTDEEVTEFFEGDLDVDPDSNYALVQSKPFIMDFEVPRDHITLDPTRVLGRGQFGSVISGSLRVKDDDWLTVAVKTVKENVDVDYFQAFLSEVKIMAFIGRHTNIVELRGTCTTSIKNCEILIALEFCPLGNLQNYLKKNRNIFEDTAFGVTKTYPSFTNTTETSFANKITTLDLLTWSQEIANGMTYLTEKKVIHGDLAARNVLLANDRVAKISDFGLSRQFFNYAHYQKTSTLPLPWRWLAVESLKEMEFSVASDVWAYGVTMWEIFSLAELPYSCWSWDQYFVDKLLSGDRLLRPVNATPEVYKLMMDCWMLKPANRPSFKRIHDVLNSHIFKLAHKTNSNCNEHTVAVQIDATTSILCESCV